MEPLRVEQREGEKEKEGRRETGRYLCSACSPGDPFYANERTNERTSDWATERAHEGEKRDNVANGELAEPVWRTSTGFIKPRL